jgi:putative ABC transport system ATP-binding protein
VCKEYKMGEDIVHALRRVNLIVNDGEFMAVVGSSGSGKSTLMHIIGGLDRPTDGRVIVDGDDLGAASEIKLSKYRSEKVGFVFQSFNLQPSLTVLENVALPLVFTRERRSERKSRAEEVLELVGLGDRLKHRPSELSGGQRQRVSIARALINNPKIILADEPTGNLDSKTSEKIVDLLKEINSIRKATVIIVTHDDKIASQAKRIIHISDGGLLN